jgi:ribosomal protein S18 acetylase RimI-like enzyme
LRCLRLAFEPFREHYNVAAYEDTVLTPESVAHRFTSMQIYVAVTDTNMVIGTIACSVTNINEGHLRGMAVIPEWQGSEVATNLLKTAEAALVARGCSIISLDTTVPLERAIHFYEKNGFQPTGHVTNFFGMPLYEYAKTITG